MKKIIFFCLTAILLAFINAPISFADPPPVEIADLSITKAGNDTHLSWSVVTTDAYSNTASIDHYNIYRGTTPDFIPDTTSGTNRIGQPNGTTFDDVDALLSEDSYYYYVMAVASDGTESLLPSNIGYKIRLALTYDPAKSNKYWLSIPYNSNYATASDLGGDALNISHVIRWDPLTQSEEVWDQVNTTGTDFTVVAGEAYAIVILDDTVLNLAGSHGPSTINMTYNANNFNVNWFSIPHPNAYGIASLLAQDIPNTTKVGRYDVQNDTYESWFFLDGSWMGHDFTLIPGEGVLGVITDDTTWTPSLGYPTVVATADVTDGLNAIEVNLSGTAEDKNGSIINYQWDYKGDGVFDYSDTLSPDTSFAYTIAGTYYPTLLVTDDDGFHGYDYQTIEVYSLENEISVENFNPSGGDTAQFTYTISNVGLMTIKIYDELGNLIRILFADQAVTAGENVATWDGRNDLAELVADGTYYVVFDYSIAGKPYTYTYDLRTSSGGEDITDDITNIGVSEILSPLEGEYVEITYTLPQKALVTIAIKEQSGTVIRHLLTDAPRTAGTHMEIWYGADDNGQIVSPGTSFYVTLEALSMADSAMITTGFAPTLTDISAEPLRFSPATNPYGTQDKSSVVTTFTLNKQASVTVTVYNSSGTAVRTFTESDLAAAQHQVAWNGRNDSGSLQTDGTYTIRLRAQDNNGTYSNVFNIQVEIFF